MSMNKLVKLVGDWKLIISLYFTAIGIVYLCYLFMMDEATLTTAVAWQGFLLSTWFGTCHFIYFAKWPAVHRITLHGVLTLAGTLGMNHLFGWVSLTGAQWLVALAIFVAIYALTLWSWWVYYRSEEAVLNRKLAQYQRQLEDC